MRKIDDTTFLIEGPDELRQAAIGYFNNPESHRRWPGTIGGVPSWYSIWYDGAPESYPFIALLEDDDERGNIDFKFVTPDMFNKE